MSVATRIVSPTARGAPAGQRGGRLRGLAILVAGFIGVGILAAPSLRAADPAGFVTEGIANGLAGPVALAAAPDGRVYVAERTGLRIRVIEDGALSPVPLAILSGSAAGERGLLGLAADPRPEGAGATAERTILYAYYTPTDDRARIVRITIHRAAALPPSPAVPPPATVGAVRIETIVDDLPAGPSQNGGALAIGPDRCLYFSVGDLGDPAATIPATSRTGRIHRVSLDGSIPPDNPWPGRSEYCRGLRNCFGLALLPAPGGDGVALYLTDNGATEDDEVNRAVAGAHLGWPEVTGAAGRSDRLDPLRTWSPTTAPVGIVGYAGNDFPAEYLGDLFFGEFVTGRIIRLGLDAAGMEVIGEEVFLDRGPTPIYALAVSPDGALWFTAGDGVFRIHRARGSAFIRGDIDGNGRVERGDVALLLAHLHGGAELFCPAAADVDGSGAIDTADAVTLLGYLGGDIRDLPPPFPDCGRVPGERLPCRVHPGCP